jgi:carbon storage regulator
MLVLRRRVGEKVTILYRGKQIEVVMLGIEGSQIKLGFDGERDFIITRSELLENMWEMEPFHESGYGSGNGDGYGSGDV